MNTELERFRAIAEDLYPPLTADDGVDIKQIERAEKDYGWQLPNVLREFYMLAGNHERIKAAHNYLLSVDYLEIKDNKLIFYLENQGVSCWAIDLPDVEKDNPPVWIGQSIEGQTALEWYIDFEQLGEFLLMMLCWQSVMGGLAVTGICDKIGKSAAQKVKDNFSRLEISEAGENYAGFKVFLDHGKVICLSENKRSANIYAGASDKAKLLEIEDLLQIEWDYCSLDDEI